MGTIKVRLLQGTLPLCVLFGHPAHGSCGISNHIVSYPITNGHTHSNLLMNPGGKYGVPAEDLGEQNTVSGSSVWGRSPPVCPQALLSGVKTGTKPRKIWGEGGHDTLHAGLEASCSKQKARKVSSSDTRQFPSSHGSQTPMLQTVVS